MSTKYVSIIERGEQSPTLQVLDRLANALGVPLHELVRIDAPDEAKQVRADVIKKIRKAPDDELLRYAQLAALLIPAHDRRRKRG